MKTKLRIRSQVFRKFISFILPFILFDPNSPEWMLHWSLIYNPANIYLFKVNNGNSRKTCEICSKLTIKTQERGHLRSGIFIVNFEHISHLFLGVSIVDFEQVNVSWVTSGFCHVWIFASSKEWFLAIFQVFRFISSSQANECEMYS